MTYDPVEDFEIFDARLFNNKDTYIGIAKIITVREKFGSNPVVCLPKNDLDMLYELGMFTRKKPVVVVKFRDKLAYLPVVYLTDGKADYFTTDKVIRNEKVEFYIIPINKFTLI